MKSIVVLAAFTFTLILGACARQDAPLEQSTTAAMERDPLVEAEQRSQWVAARTRAPRPAAAEEKAMLADRAPAAAGSVAEPWRAPPPARAADREIYEHPPVAGVQRVSESPVSTFSIDVDTGAYANLRRFLDAGRLPPVDAVRIEEMINYFDYGYAPPADETTPFAIHTATGPTPWNPRTRLLRVGIKGYKPDGTMMPPANLVFLIDVSGSMRDAGKLDLVKTALNMLSHRLRAEDTVAIAVYAGSSGVVLEPTPGSEPRRIRAAIDALAAGGSTNGASGIRLAYDLARRAFRDDGINRVILATDGDFNVGTVDFDTLVDLVSRERRGGVSLTTLGFGAGNYNDHLMERLADAGDGNHAYIDSAAEARKVLVDEMRSTLHTIAADVKIQIEFNPAVVAEYRLIGYENRLLRREDFNNDRVDAGEIGAGHTVTALYEFALAGSGGERLNALRYTRESRASNNGELGWLSLRYKQPGAANSRLLEQPVRDDGNGETDQDFRFAAAVAAFGQLLKHSAYLDDLTFEDIAGIAAASRGADPFGYRAEFLSLVRTAAVLDIASTPGPRAPAG